ncbi:hypothetical protein, partial [Streptomyces sp. SID5770]|uniref:hypothetical protein n=1 Tax=Streptomyces sp. SID5770 TaxID=2690308 RepID=UPI001F40B17D
LELGGDEVLGGDSHEPDPSVILFRDPQHQTEQPERAPNATFCTHFGDQFYAMAHCDVSAAWR